jgi:D-apionolactonase
MIDEPLVFYTGQLQVTYHNGFIRNIRYGDHEIVRMAYFALRDENWDTLEPHIRNQAIDRDANSFQVSYDCIHKKNGSDIFRWNVKIVGNGDDTITFEIQGVALTDLKKNRAGFCILHPIRNHAGNPVTIMHPEGSTTQSKFPVQVSADNPFKNIRSLQWSTVGHTFEVSMDGDIFETEDQRNWTDASYKTFCTPSSKPIPVILKKGEEIFQKVTFRSVEALPPVEFKDDADIVLDITKNKLKLPAIGLCASTTSDSLNADAVKILKALNIDHYRIEVTPAQHNWVATYSHDYLQAFSLGLPLFVALHVSENYKDELNAFVTLSLQNRVTIRHVLLLSDAKPVTDQQVIDFALEHSKPLLPKAKWGAGTNYNFTEINQRRFDASTLDFVSYSAHPQEHAFDDFTLIENLEGQFETATSAAMLYKDQNIYISPITLRKRFNPAAADPSKKVRSEEEKSDPRQCTTFNARWTFGSLSALARAGLTAATYFQTIGPQGLLSATNEPYPVYELLLKLRPYFDQDMYALTNAHPERVDGMLFQHSEMKTLWLVNHTSIARKVRVENQTIELGSYELKQILLNRS